MGTVAVPHAAASAGEIRRLLAADLGSRGVTGPALEEAALLVTELLGNAVQHARSLPDDRVLVSWRIEGDRLHIRVTDGGSVLEQPHVAQAGPYDTRGRGLTIVDALATQWGVDRSRGSTTVWASLQVPARPGEPTESAAVIGGRHDGGTRRPQLSGT